MGFPKGNEYWKIRSVNGRSKKFTPKEMLEKANEYFEWCIENPLKEQNAFHYQGHVTKDDITKLRPFTIKGLCHFLDITERTFKDYEKYDGFIHITTRIKEVIYNQKFEGAASGFFQANIIARDLGLRDRADVTSGDEPVKAQKTVIKFNHKT